MRAWDRWNIGIAVMAVMAGAAGARAAETVASHAPSKDASLDGMTFVGEMGEQGKTKGDSDTFVFQDGTFQSAACEPYGFEPASYTATEEGNAVTFHAKAESSNEGTMTWTGAMNGEELTGTAIWTKPGKHPVEYWFKAKPQQAS